MTTAMVVLLRLSDARERSAEIMALMNGSFCLLIPKNCANSLTASLTPR